MNFGDAVVAARVDWFTAKVNRLLKPGQCVNTAAGRGHCGITQLRSYAQEHRRMPGSDRILADKKFTANAYDTSLELTHVAQRIIQ